MTSTSALQVVLSCDEIERHASESGTRVRVVDSVNSLACHVVEVITGTTQKHASIESVVYYRIGEWRVQKGKVWALGFAAFSLLFVMMFFFALILVLISSRWVADAVLNLMNVVWKFLHDEITVLAVGMDFDQCVHVIRRGLLPERSFLES